MEKYIEFKKHFSNNPFITDLLHYIQESKLEEEVVAFYPKNWFVNDTTPEIIVFTKKDIVRVKKDYKTLEIDVYKDFKVTKLSYFENLNDRYAGSKLEISLQSGDQLILNAAENVNANYEDWTISLSQYIGDIYKTLK